MDSGWYLLIWMQNGIGSKPLSSTEGTETNGLAAVNIKSQKLCLLQAQPFPALQIKVLPGLAESQCCDRLFTKVCHLVKSLKMALPLKV